MMKLSGLGLLVALGLGTVSCATDDGAQPTVSSGNDAVGIARFQVDDTANMTRVIGLDARGSEVARLELTHGRFALTGQFTADYPGQTEVDGRKLEVTIGGEQRLIWETAGYDPTLQMPAHPRQEQELIAFLDDPHAKAVLDRWQIGFQTNRVFADETEFGSGTTTGTSFTSCSNATSCGTARGLPINMCGSNATSKDASRVTRSSPYNEYMIDQCCPADASTPYNWFGEKSCPTTGTGAQPSTCGTTSATGACKACAGYPASAAGFCEVQWTGSQIKYCFDSAGACGTFTIGGANYNSSSHTLTVQYNVPSPGVNPVSGADRMEFIDGAFPPNVWWSDNLSGTATLGTFTSVQTYNYCPHGNQYVRFMRGGVQMAMTYIICP